MFWNGFPCFWQILPCHGNLYKEKCGVGYMYFMKVMYLFKGLKKTNFHSLPEAICNNYHSSKHDRDPSSSFNFITFLTDTSTR